MKKIESFTLDHRLVKAPYIRKAADKTLVGGSRLLKYDVRFTQPNDGAPLSTAAVHSLEHSLATTLREHTEGVIDLSPMGCRTGFYAVVDAGVIPTQDEFKEIFLQSLRDIFELTEVPGASIVECGNAADHDLTAALTAAEEFLYHSEELDSVFGEEK